MLCPVQDVIPLQDDSCNRMLFLIFPGTYPGEGKRGEKAAMTKVRAGAELRGRSQPSPAAR